MEKKGRRGEIVLSTKYALSLMTGHPVQQSNYGGTGTKSMHASVETSLRRLRTSYIDIVCHSPRRLRYSTNDRNSSMFTPGTTLPRFQNCKFKLLSKGF